MVLCAVWFGELRSRGNVGLRLFECAYPWVVIWGCVRVL
jgi:hypothetical protein